MQSFHIILLVNLGWRLALPPPASDIRTCCISHTTGIDYGTSASRAQSLQICSNRSRHLVWFFGVGHLLLPAQRLSNVGRGHCNCAGTWTSTWQALPQIQMSKYQGQGLVTRQMLCAFLTKLCTTNSFGLIWILGFHYCTCCLLFYGGSRQHILVEHNGF